MKKRGNVLAAGLICAILTTALTVPVFAHGHGQHNGSVQRVQTSVTVCAEADCTLPGRHFHSGWIYCGYDHENGLCDGSCSVAVCPYEDCTVSGRHLHDDDNTYCGYHRENRSYNGSSDASSSRNHGHHHGRG